MKKLLFKYADAAFWKIINKRRPFDIERMAYLKAAYESAEFIENEMPMAANLRQRKALWLEAARRVTVSGLWLEFGVHQGESIRVIADQTTNTVYGFDSFEGLPEDWTFFQKKGRFSLDGKPPENMPDNVEFVKGWFNESLPDFLGKHEDPVAFLHIDSDLYSSAKTVLDLLQDRIVPGTVVLFDELLNYPGWKSGEAKAWLEFLSLTGHNAEYFGYASSAHSVGLVIA